MIFAKNLQSLMICQGKKSKSNIKLKQAHHCIIDICLHAMGD
jgi:hypothetical protein